MAAGETATINAVPLTVAGAWRVEDLTELLGAGPLRGEDRAVPGVAGRAARPRVRDSWDVLLALDVYGVNDVAGTPHANRRIGVRDNVEYLIDELCPPYPADSTTVVVTYSDASTRSASCVVNSVEVNPATFRYLAEPVRAVVDLTVLPGRLS